MGRDVKKLWKDTHNPDPTKAWRTTRDMITPDMPEAPGESPEQVQQRRQQNETLAMLNDETNRKLKRLLSASQGMRAFRGSALSRGSPSNKPGSVGAGSLADVTPSAVVQMAPRGGDRFNAGQSFYA